MRAFGLSILGIPIQDVLNFEDRNPEQLIANLKSDKVIFVFIQGASYFPGTGCYNVLRYGP